MAGLGNCCAQDNPETHPHRERENGAPLTQDHLNTTGEIPIPVPSTSLWLDLEADRMHIRRFGDPNHVPVLLLHGSVEDGRVFYSRKGKGLAPYLAINGFEVFVPDFRGHGYSTPRRPTWRRNSSLPIPPSRAAN